MSEPSHPPSEFTIWVVSDGRRGIENQALGLAEAVARALGTDTRIERVTVRKDGFVTLPAASHPNLWIGCGRAAVGVARKHRRIFADCLFVYVQDPRGRYDTFDLIVAPEHDRLRRENAVSMIGSPNRIVPAQVEAARARFADRIDALPAPRAAVLIGGASKRFRRDPRNRTIPRAPDRIAAGPGPGRDGDGLAAHAGRGAQGAGHPLRGRSAHLVL